MKVYPYEIAGDLVTVNVPENARDLREFWRWFEDANKRGPIALDTETTGLDI